METIAPSVLVAGMLVGVAASLVGSFLLLRKLTLVSDSLPHIALPGIALGVIGGFNPLLGGLIFLILAALLIWLLEFKTKLEVDSITGVLFVTALAVGSTLVEEHELLESFFGDLTSVSSREALLLSLAAAAIIGLVMWLRRRLVLHSIAPELARGSGMSPKVTELIFLSLIALTIALGIKFVGILLMSSLLIVPAVTSRLVAGESLLRYQTGSAILGFLAIALGMLFSGYLGIPAGVLTVLSGGVFFVVGLLASFLRGSTK